MNKFADNQEIQGVYFSLEGDGYISGRNCEKITVSMERGQMSEVPWFAIWKNGKIVEKFNGAIIASVDNF